MKESKKKLNAYLPPLCCHLSDIGGNSFECAAGKTELTRASPNIPAPWSCPSTSECPWEDEPCSGVLLAWDLRSGVPAPEPPEEAPKFDVSPRKFHNRKLVYNKKYKIQINPNTYSFLQIKSKFDINYVFKIFH